MSVYLIMARQVASAPLASAGPLDGSGRAREDRWREETVGKGEGNAYRTIWEEMILSRCRLDFNGHAVKSGAPGAVVLAVPFLRVVRLVTESGDGVGDQVHVCLVHYGTTHGAAYRVDMLRGHSREGK